MKKTAIFVALALSAFISNAQEVIELKEAKVGHSLVLEDLTNKGNLFSMNIKESSSGEFVKDPIGFMKTHFDIKDVIKDLGDHEYDLYYVTFKSKKGVFNAEYDDQGNMLVSSFKLKNISVPIPLQHQLYRDYKGWAMVSNLHVASEVKGKTIRDFYTVKLKKGNQKKKIKINTADIGRSTVVAVN